MVRFVIGQNLASIPLSPEIDALLRSGTVGMACKLPWERMVGQGEPSHHHRPTGRHLPPYPESITPAPAPAPTPAPAPAPAPAPQEPPTRRVIHPRIIKERPLERMHPQVPEAHGPGCTAADGSLLAHGYLSNLGEGKAGFGVLRLGKEKLEEGAEAARLLGERELAGEMLAIAGELPDVHDAEAAQRMADRLKPVVDSSWELGLRCKGGLPTLPTEEQSERVHDLAMMVQAGQITMNQAISEVKGEILV